MKWRNVRAAIGPEMVFGLIGVLLILSAVVFSVTGKPTWATPTGLGLIGFGAVLAAFWKHIKSIIYVPVVLILVGAGILIGHYLGWF